MVETPPPRGKAILVVDDDADLREVLADVIKGTGRRVLMATESCWNAPGVVAVLPKPFDVAALTAVLKKFCRAPLA